MLNDIRAWLENSLWKSLRRLVQVSGILKKSAYNATKLLKLEPYKLSIVHWLQPGTQVLEFISVNGYWMYGAWFHLHGHVSTKSNRYWSSKKSNNVHEMPLPDPKEGMYCAISGIGIIGSIFIVNMFTSMWYVKEVLQLFSTN